MVFFVFVCWMWICLVGDVWCYVVILVVGDGFGLVIIWEDWD